MDYCRSCGRNDQDAKLGARTVRHPATGKQYVITLCEKCAEKAGRGDPEILDKLSPFLK